MFKCYLTGHRYAEHLRRLLIDSYLEKSKLCNFSSSPVSADLYHYCHSWLSICQVAAAPLGNVLSECIFVSAPRYFQQFACFRVMFKMCCLLGYDSLLIFMVFSKILIPKITEWKLLLPFLKPECLRDAVSWRYDYNPQGISYECMYPGQATCFVGHDMGRGKAISGQCVATYCHGCQWMGSRRGKVGSAGVMTLLLQQPA